MALRLSAQSVISRIKKVQESNALKGKVFLGLFAVLIVYIVIGAPVLLFLLAHDGGSPATILVLAVFQFSAGIAVAWLLYVAVHKNQNDEAICEKAIASLRTLERRFQGRNPSEEDQQLFAIACEKVLQEALNGLLEPVGFRMTLPKIPDMPFADVLIAHGLLTKSHSQADDENAGGDAAGTDG